MFTRHGCYVYKWASKAVNCQASKILENRNELKAPGDISQWWRAWAASLKFSVQSQKKVNKSKIWFFSWSHPERVEVAEIVFVWNAEPVGVSWRRREEFSVAYDVCHRCVVLTLLPPGNAGSSEEADPLGEVLYFPGDGKFRVPFLPPSLPLLLWSQCIP